MDDFAPKGEAGRLYGQTRVRVSELVGNADGDAPVPACPEWTVKDVLAHLSGVCADILGGRLDGVATDPWTARQVGERRDWSVEKILAEWSTNAPQCEELSQHFPNGADIQWMSDCITHEHDIRGALGKPGARDFHGIKLGLRWLVAALASDIPTAFTITTDEGDELVCGSGEIAGGVRAPRFEMVRALTGRRSRDQIAGFDWNADCEQFLPAFSRGPFTLAAQAITE